MIQYVRATETGTDVIYHAFQRGFSDYMIPIKISKEDFEARFFGPEGNQKVHSFVALDEHEPVGLALGGVKTYESVKTMRCGTLAIHPDYRGKGISARLMDLHREEAMAAGCKQLFLEVIAGNDRAIAFYNKRGYRKFYDIFFFTLADAGKLGNRSIPEGGRISRVTFQEFAAVIQAWKYFHVNWQNDLDYQELDDRHIYYILYINDNPVGCLSVTSGGKISMLVVDISYRGQGAATALLTFARDELSIAKFSASTPNNALLECFFERCGFTRDNLSLYEMYILL